MALLGAAVLAAGLLAGVSTATAGTNTRANTVITSSGLKPGAIKHVWLIILENKSYDATFTGLNQNSYLWKTLPSQGVLLKNYYGTGHYSQDNYLSLVSGQAPEQDTQSDCSVENFDFGTNANIMKTRREPRAGVLAGERRAAERRQRAERRERLHVPDGRRRRCSTSSTPPARPGRATRRTSQPARA